jgi:hypothetical protein
MDEPDWRKYLRKLKWVVITLVAPEIVVFAGFEQWLTARQLLKRLHRIHDIRFPKDEKVGCENLPFKHIESDRTAGCYPKPPKAQI